jgi:uncharacterized protein YndB with AHSA1/START domain
MDARRESKPAKHPVERKSDRELVIRRTFDAPARLVFEAWTRPELFRRWWVPKSLGMTIREIEMDVRVGGKYRINFGEGMDFYGEYVEVKPHTRLAWTNDEGGEPGPVTTVTLEEKDGKTLLVVSELYPSTEALDKAGTGAWDAIGETFGQLDEVLLTQGVAAG